MLLEKGNWTLLLLLLSICQFSRNNLMSFLSKPTSVTIDWAKYVSFPSNLRVLEDSDGNFDGGCPDPAFTFPPPESEGGFSLLPGRLK